MTGHIPARENPLDIRLHKIKTEQCCEERNNLIQDYIPFIIRVISKQLNRYIETENCDEFSIGLVAFNDAIDKYDSAKGGFLSFAELVIRNRIKDELRKQLKDQREVSLEECQESSLGRFNGNYGQIDDDVISIKEEIRVYEQELAKFAISFEDLVKETPKHTDTRQNAIKLSTQISDDKPIVEEIYAKKRLPIKKIALKYETTVKILKRSKKFIVSIVIILTGNFWSLKNWVKNTWQGESDV